MERYFELLLHNNIALLCALDINEIHLPTTYFDILNLDYKHNLNALKVRQRIGRVPGSLLSAKKQPWSSYGLVICCIFSFVGKHTLATQGWAF